LRIEYRDLPVAALIDFNKTNPMIYTAIPVVIVFSLCYAATRYEDLRSIFQHTLYFGGWLSFAMIMVMAIMEAMQWYLR